LTFVDLDTVCVGTSDRTAGWTLHKSHFAKWPVRDSVSATNLRISRFKPDRRDVTA